MKTESERGPERLSERSRKLSAVFGVYPDRKTAERAVGELLDAGFLLPDISLLQSERSTSDTLQKNSVRPDPHADGAAMGAGTGAIVGGTLGLLAGLGALSIPGFGPFIAAGPILAALGGIGVGGALGSVSGTLIGLGIPEYEAKLYETHFHAGKIILSVHTENLTETASALKILHDSEASDITLKKEESRIPSTARTPKENRASFENSPSHEPPL